MSDTGGFVVKDAMAFALNIESMQLNTGVLKLYPLPIPEVMSGNGNSGGVVRTWVSQTRLYCERMNEL